MCIDTKSFLQIGVDTGQVHPVIQWYQYKGDDHITQQVTQHNLVIIKIAGSYPAWYTHECNAGERCTNHTKCHQHPVTVAVTDKEGFII